MLCCGYTLTDLPISIRLTSLALWQSSDCPSASKATLMNMDKHFMWIHYEWLHNHNKAKHNKTVCIFLGIYCRYKYCRGCFEWIQIYQMWSTPTVDTLGFLAKLPVEIWMQVYFCYWSTIYFSQSKYWWDTQKSGQGSAWALFQYPIRRLIVRSRKSRKAARLVFRIALDSYAYKSRMCDSRSLQVNVYKVIIQEETLINLCNMSSHVPYL